MQVCHWIFPQRATPPLQPHHTPLHHSPYQLSHSQASWFHIISPRTLYTVNTTLMKSSWSIHVAELVHLYQRCLYMLIYMHGHGCQYFSQGYLDWWMLWSSLFQVSPQHAGIFPWLPSSLSWLESVPLSWVCMWIGIREVHINGLKMHYSKGELFIGDTFVDYLHLQVCASTYAFEHVSRKHNMACSRYSRKVWPREIRCLWRSWAVPTPAVRISTILTDSLLYESRPGNFHANKSNVIRTTDA